MLKDCPHCGTQFKTYPSIDQKFCNKQCAFAYQKKQTYDKYKCNCAVCDKEFLPARPKEGGKFCSYTCSGIAQRKERVKREGYWYICAPEHPNSSKQGYVAEHRLIMEAYIGRYLKPDEVVHHMDHDRSNNSLSNLQLMTDSEHKTLHARERDRGQNERFI